MAAAILLASGSYDRSVRLWKIGNGEQTRHIPFNESQVNCLSLSLDGTLMVVGGFGVAKIYDVTPPAGGKGGKGPRGGGAIPVAKGGADDEPLIQLPSGSHSGNVMTSGFLRLPSVTAAAVAAANANAAETGGGPTGAGATDASSSVSTQPAAATPNTAATIANAAVPDYVVYTVGDEGKIKLWDISCSSLGTGRSPTSTAAATTPALVPKPRTGWSIRLRAEADAKAPINSAVVHPTHRALFVATQNSQLQTWLLEKEHIMEGGGVGVPMSTTFASMASSSASPTATPSLHQTATGGGGVSKRLMRIGCRTFQRDDSSIRTLSVSSNGQLLIAGNSNGRVYAFGISLSQVTSSSSNIKTTEMSSSSDNNGKQTPAAAAAADADGSNSNKSSPPPSSNNESSSSQNNIKNSNNNNNAPGASTGSSSSSSSRGSNPWVVANEVTLPRSTTTMGGTDLRQLFALSILWTYEASARYILKVALSPDSKILATTGADGMTVLWRVPQRFGTEAAVAAVAESQQQSQSPASPAPDASAASSSSSSSDGVPSSQWTVSARLSAHNRWVWDVVWSRDGQFLVTCGSDHTARLWSLNGRLLTSYTGHLKPVTCCLLDERPMLR